MSDEAAKAFAKALQIAGLAIGVGLADQPGVSFILIVMLAYVWWSA